MLYAWQGSHPIPNPNKPMAYEPFKASDEDWQAIEAASKSFYQIAPRAILELRDRLVDLEATPFRVIVRNESGVYQKAGTPVYLADPAPEGDERLVDTIADIIGNEPIIGRPCPAAKSAILAVAKWLRRVGNNGSADELELEANR